MHSIELAGYHVLAELGSGARSTIYAVKDRHDHVFALKHVIRNGPQDDRFLQQALHEHEIAHKFDHPSLRKSLKLIRGRKVIRTSEIFILMELVDGQTMEQYHIPAMSALCTLCELAAEGLGVMHDQGYVHADIKPNNVMVTDHDKIKIIDFGQSCRIGTVKERVQGTPDYIAPEQVRKEAITERTDVFNLGATMYFLLVGKPVPTMLPRGTPGLSMREENKCQPPIEVNPLTPPALSRLVMQSISSRPEDRPGSMKEVIERLELARSQALRAESNGMRQSTG